MFEGVDILTFEGVSYSIVLSLISEVGVNGIKKFASAKHFCSSLRLVPNNKISGGKVFSSKIPKGSNRLKTALRNAANAIRNLKDTHIFNFFNRVCCRKGRTIAVSATTRKLAIIIWNVVAIAIPYTYHEGYLFLDQKRKLALVKRIQNQITKLGLDKNDLAFATS